MGANCPGPGDSHLILSMYPNSCAFRIIAFVLFVCDLSSWCNATVVIPLGPEALIIDRILNRAKLPRCSNEPGFGVKDSGE
jgi:hypothetical protein